MVSTPAKISVSNNNNSGNDPSSTTYNEDGSIFVPEYNDDPTISDFKNQLDITKESDLDVTALPPSQSLLAVEYSEERPPLILNKGMASNIVNYYRGDRRHCPISAGGGDVPHALKAKLNRSSSIEQIITDNANPSAGYFVGPEDKEEVQAELKRQQQTERLIAEKKAKKATMSKLTADEFLPHGKTQVIDVDNPGPFVAEIEQDAVQPTLTNNCFIAPLFMHPAAQSDFLLTVPRKQSQAKVVNSDKFSGQFQAMPNDAIKVIISPFPRHIAVVGQTEPKTRVFAPNSNMLNEFNKKFLAFQIGRNLEFKGKKDIGLSREEIQKKLFANTDFNRTVLDKRLKELGDLDPARGEYFLKEDYPGTAVLAKKIGAEQICAYESYHAARRRLEDLGLDKLIFPHLLPLAQTAVGFFGANVTTLKARLREMKKREKMSAISRAVSKTKRTLHENTKSAVAKFEKDLDEERRKLTVARFALEEISIAPWNTSSDLMDVHRKQGSSLLSFMRLTGVGDPSGRGEAMSFLREPDGKIKSAVAVSTDESKMADGRHKLVGEESDLRKLSMPKLGAILRSYGIAQQDIDELKVSPPHTHTPTHSPTHIAYIRLLPSTYKSARTKAQTPGSNSRRARQSAL